MPIDELEKLIKEKGRYFVIEEQKVKVLSDDEIPSHDTEKLDKFVPYAMPKSLKDRLIMLNRGGCMELALMTAIYGVPSRIFASMFYYLDPKSYPLYFYALRTIFNTKKRNMVGSWFKRIERIPFDASLKQIEVKLQKPDHFIYICHNKIGQGHAIYISKIDSNIFLFDSNEGLIISKNNSSIIFLIKKFMSILPMGPLISNIITIELNLKIDPQSMIVIRHACSIEPSIMNGKNPISDSINSPQDACVLHRFKTDSQHAKLSKLVQCVQFFATSGSDQILSDLLNGASNPLLMHLARIFSFQSAATKLNINLFTIRETFDPSYLSKLEQYKKCCLLSPENNLIGIIGRERFQVYSLFVPDIGLYIGTIEGIKQQIKNLSETRLTESDQSLKIVNSMISGRLFYRHINKHPIGTLLEETLVYRETSELQPQLPSAMPSAILDGSAVSANSNCEEAMVESKIAAIIL